MTKEQILEDLDYASRIARDGANTPLLGGSIGLMWGCLLVPTLILHGLVLMNLIPIAEQLVGFFWMAYGIIGTILSIVLGKRIGRKAGSSSNLNKLSTALGMTMGLLIFLYAITTLAAFITNGLPPFMFNTIIVFAFGMVAINMGVLAYMSGLSYLRNAAIMAGAFMVITLFMVQQDYVYFIAAIGVVFTQILPSLTEIRREPKNDI